MIRLVKGDLFQSTMQVLTNPVNCVGVMGAGLAKQFRARFPVMYNDYIGRCSRKVVRLGKPYLWRQPDGYGVLNFPTKQHWRDLSRKEDIVAGLVHLTQHCKEWSIESLAVPPLGCGLGGLPWADIGPVLMQHLEALDIPVELYTP